MRDKKTQLGVFLCYLLRHHPENLGLNLDKNGFTDKTISELYMLIKQRKKYSWITKPILEDVILNDTKGRFEVSGDFVRALYGHSFPVDIKINTLLEELPETLYHGTQEINKESILTKGLISGNRQFVHLSGSLETAKKVAKRRKGVSIIFSINTKKAYEAGYQFKAVGNDTILTKRISPELLELID